MAWEYHEPGEGATLNVADGEQVFHVAVHWPEIAEPLHAEVCARDVEQAHQHAVEAFSRIPGRQPIARVQVWPIDEWVRR